jgi:hypothetical protein
LRRGLAKEEKLSSRFYLIAEELEENEGAYRLIRPDHEALVMVQ